MTDFFFYSSFVLVMILGAVVLYEILISDIEDEPDDFIDINNEALMKADVDIKRKAIVREVVNGRHNQ